MRRPPWKPRKPSSSRKRPRRCARPGGRKPRLRPKLPPIRTRRRRAKRKRPRRPKVRSDQGPVLGLLVGFLRLVWFGGWRGVRFRLARFAVEWLSLALGFGRLGPGGLGIVRLGGSVGPY